jgi:hypothetical protein
MALLRWHKRRLDNNIPKERKNNSDRRKKYQLSKRQCRNPRPAWLRHGHKSEVTRNKLQMK